MSGEAERLRRLQAQVFDTFRDETAEGLARLETQLLALDADVDRAHVDELFRVVHTIKGGAGSFGLRAMAELAHAMEAHLDQLRKGASPTPAGVAALLEGADALRALLDAPGDVPRDTYAALCARLAEASAPNASGASGGSGPSATPARPRRVAVDLVPGLDFVASGIDLALLLEQLAELGPTTVDVDARAVPPLASLDLGALALRWRVTVETTTAPEAIELLFAWLGDTCAVHARAADDTRPADAPRAAQAGASSKAAQKAPARVDASVRVPIEKLDDLMNLVGELVIAGSALHEVERGDLNAPDRRARAREALARLDRLTRGMHESVLRMRSLPVGLVFNRFPRLVHDLATRLGKDVRLEVRGEGTELDKTVLERLGDPLVHLVRNSLDHGLETPDARREAGKSATGTLRLTAEQSANEVVITVEDDGRGLDPQRIFRRAVERGLVAADAALSEAEMQRLILAPGFSTAEQVSDISGRGVGMDVVASTIQALGGELSLHSVVGAGLTVTLRLPLTLAIIDGQLVRFGGRTWVLPLGAIAECARVEPGALDAVLGRGLVYAYGDESLPVLDPCAGLGLGGVPPGGRLVMVLEAQGERVALLVDEVLARQQIVVKSLEQHLRAVPGLSGATVLGDGAIAFILDVPGLRRACPVAHPRRVASARVGAPS